MTVKLILVLMALGSVLIILGACVHGVAGAGDASPGKRPLIAFNGRRTPAGLIQVYAHRGGRGLLPEHTLPAYTAALRVGCDYVDMDVNMTRDGVLVVTHDPTLNPDLTTDAAGNRITEKRPIYSMTHADLRAYNVGHVDKDSPYGRRFPHQGSLDAAAIPTLLETVRHVKRLAGDRVGFQIEMKRSPNRPQLSPSPQVFAAALYALLKDENILDRTEVQAFDWTCLLELARIDSQVKTAFLSAHTTVSLSAAETGTWTAGLRPADFDYSLPRMVKHLGGWCWGPYEMDLTRDALEEAHRLGLKVVVWGWPEKEGTQFNQEAVSRLADWGVDGIITDRADMLRGVLAAKGFNVPPGLVFSD